MDTTTVNSSDLMAYVEVLEVTNNELLTDNAVLSEENAALRRSLRTFKGNSTRVKAQKEQMRQENAQLANEVAALKRSITSYKAAATRRAKA